MTTSLLDSPASHLSASGPRVETSLRRVETIDPAEVAAVVLGQTSGTVRLHPLTGSEVPEVRARAFDFGSARLGEIRMPRATVQIPDDRCYTLLFQARGAMRFAVRGRAASLTQDQWAIVSPGPSTVDFLSPDCRVLQLRFDPDCLMHELAAILGRTPTRPLHFEIPLRGAAVSSVRQVVHFLRNDASNPALSHHKHLSDGLVRLAAGALILNAQHNFSEDLVPPIGGGFTGTGPIRRAVELLEDDPMQITTIGDLAQTVALSVSALEQGFKRHTGTTPLKYRRGLRLARARRDLREADVEETTATAVAYRWGFTNYGRFCAEYRRAFGGSPFEDLSGSTRSPASRPRP